MSTSTPVQLATVKMDALRSEQWEIALLLLKALSGPLSAEEVSAEVRKLSAVISSATVTWTTE